MSLNHSLSLLTIQLYARDALANRRFLRANELRRQRLPCPEGFAAIISLFKSDFSLSESSCSELTGSFSKDSITSGH